MPRLVITKGNGTGREFAVGTEAVVGRAADVDFVLEDVGASRRHCRVSAQGGVYVVEDLGSRNGTWVNGTRVQRGVLKDGDLIRVGGVEIAFRQKSATDASAASGSATAPTPGSTPAPASAPPAPEKPKYDINPRRRRTHW
jgi:pSer/pThr/pTyr-binding forkhead associated (FHA) protein